MIFGYYTMTYDMWITMQDDLLYVPLIYHDCKFCVWITHWEDDIQLKSIYFEYSMAFIESKP